MINTFIDLRTELVEKSSKKDEVTEGSLKRAGEELEQENTKKQKIEDDKEYSLTIVDYKIYKEGKNGYI
nr:hypothetical protein [Tanacetum cinerariifolium]